MPKEKELNQEQLKFIFAEDWPIFTGQLLNNCHCPCAGGGYDATIVDYQIFLNDLNHVILRGKCAKCGDPLNRYLETGENEGYLGRIKELKIK